MTDLFFDNRIEAEKRKINLLPFYTIVQKSTADLTLSLTFAIIGYLPDYLSEKDEFQDTVINPGHIVITITITYD